MRLRRVDWVPVPPGWPNRKTMLDTESLIVDREHGTAWVGLARINQLWRFDSELKRLEARHAPAALRDWPSGRGPEAMARLAEIEEAYLAESEALFESLDGLAPAQPRRGEGGDGPGGFSPEEMERWESISGRLRFRHRELDYGAVRSLRELVGPEQASRIEWSEGRSRPSATFSFIGG